MRKTVLIIADSDPRKKIIGGIPIYAHHLTKHLIDKNINVIYLGKKQEGKIINKFKNFKYIEITKKINSSNYVFLMGLFRIAKKIKLDENTVIHAQRPDWLVPFAKRKNKKILTLHGSHSKNVYLKKSIIIGKLYSQLEKKGLISADTIISVSEENKSYYETLYKKYPKILNKMIVIPVGIDISKFKNISKENARKKYGLKKSDKVVVYVGRFEKEKNLEMLINACHNAQVKLMLVGNGREENKLKQLSKQLESDTIFIPPIKSELVPEVLSCGDVFGLTSLYEGIPTVVMEALAVGIPIVSTDVGDIKKLVEEGKTGFIVNKDNIVKKIKFLIKNNSKYKKDCIKKAKKYSWQDIGAKILKSYEI